MAQPHRTEGYTNPEVRYERNDLRPWNLTKFVLYLLALTVLSVVFGAWMAGWLFRREQPIKESVLPEALVRPAGSKGELPPIPLEAIEDIRKRQVALFPPRAANYYRADLERLANGDPVRGVEKIATTFEAMEGRLPTRKSAEAPPATYTIRLPSKAASGRVETGGQ